MTINGASLGEERLEWLGLKHDFLLDDADEALLLDRGRAKLDPKGEEPYATNGDPCA